MSKTQKQSLLQLQSQTLKFGAASKWPVCLILNGRGRGCAGLANAAIVKPNANRCWKLRTSSLPGRVQHINQLPDSSWSCVAMVHASLSTVSLVTRWSVFMVCMYNFLANSLSRPASEVGAISQSLQVAKKCCTTKKMEENAANAATAGRFRQNGSQLTWSTRRLLASAGDPSPAVWRTGRPRWHSSWTATSTGRWSP